MDTVEWGSAEPVRRRLPSLRYAVPRVGGAALAGIGFALLVAAELVPWAAVQAAGTAGARVATFGGTDLTIGMDRIATGISATPTWCWPQ